MNGLILHCGADHVTRDELALLPQPTARGVRHAPLHHADYVHMVTENLMGSGFHIADEAFGATKDGDRFFGVMRLQHDALSKFTRDESYGFALGLRGSHDMSLSRGFAFGSQVFVCDNLAFSGEVTFTTKHTINLMDRLPGLIYQAVERILPEAEHQADRFESYQDAFITDSMADAAITEIVRQGIVNPSEVLKLIKEWDTPSHEEFQEPNVYRLFNATTEVLKPRNPEHPRLPHLAPKTAKLHTICDHLALAA